MKNKIKQLLSKNEQNYGVFAIESTLESTISFMMDYFQRKLHYEELTTIDKIRMHLPFITIYVVTVQCTEREWRKFLHKYELKEISI